MLHPSRLPSALALACALAGSAGALAQEARAAAPGAPLTLEQAVSLAQERNERSLAAGERAQAAGARVSRARAFFFPELALTGTYTRRLRETTRVVNGEPQVTQAASALSSAASARMTLFDARGFPLYRAAKLDSRAADLEAREARRLIGFEAADAFLATLNAQQVQGAAQQRLTFAQKSLADARARAEGGLASTNDVTRAELEVASAEVEAADAGGSADQSVLELGYLLVAPPQGALAEPVALLEAAQAAPAGADVAGQVQDAVDRRPDLAALRWRMEALKANAQEPLARLLPSLGFSGQYRWSEDAIGGNAAHTDGFVSLDLTWTLFDGGERYAERRERAALARASRLELDASLRRVKVDLSQAQVGLTRARASLKQGELAAKVARRNVDETGELYRQGLASALAVSDANLRLFEAEVALARARFGLGLALLDLRAAQGLDALGKEP
ncbi:TolC family protein [Aggregicoccus sp. 17bor-14]|uniref:TolC family protein n=1 Tax=Myxococcaceae TaxID=31 RepID=UPI00129C168F|nr:MULTISPECIES: TolC family protein [Myxococcaceae]MBF5040937.1 TolC family protein [Simulacricoccus sp. 17bor-14]MRI86725.1 TolC family protein [Aggregicoccus sp. 17bor-14]